MPVESHYDHPPLEYPVPVSYDDTCGYFPGDIMGLLQSCLSYMEGKLVPYGLLRNGVLPSYAFGFHFSQSGCCYAAGAPIEGDALSEACAAVGYKGEWCEDDTFAGVWGLIEKQIDNGHPLLCGGLWPAGKIEKGLSGGCDCARWGIVCGYDDTEGAPQVYVAGVGKAVSWTPLANTEKDDPYAWIGMSPTWSSIAGHWKKRPVFSIVPAEVKQRSVADVLRKAVTLASAGAEPKGPHKLIAGLEGLRAWRKSFGATVPCEKSEEDLYLAPLFHMASGTSYVDRRRKACAWLRSYTGRIPRHDGSDPAWDALWQASVEYGNSVREMEEFNDALFGRDWARTWREAMVGPGKKQALSHLDRVIEYEQKAVKALETALSHVADNRLPAGWDKNPNMVSAGRWAYYWW